MNRNKTTDCKIINSLGACIAAGIVILMLTQTGQAQDSGIFGQTQERIRITSEQMVMQSNANAVEFTDNVHATQGGTELFSDRLKIFYKSGDSVRPREAGMNESSIERIEAEGSVVIHMEDKTARGQKAVYTAEDGLLILTGSRVEIKSSDSVIAGKKVTLNRDTGEIVVSGNGENQVEAVFESGSEPGPAGRDNKEAGRTRSP